jgi:STE24 endopeptidase
MAFALGLLAVLDRTAWFWSWAGATGIRDLRAIPVLLLFALVLNLLSLPIANTVSRHFESSADRIALELTHDPKAGTEVFRRLAFSNLSDLRPPRLAVWVFFTHPPIPDRINSLLHPQTASS